MRLKKLEIQGFKSFADRTTVTFEQGVTGIVGPNGCGKSNISDAVRWVLGEQSAKTLRGAKMEDVIFGGTEKRRRLSFCEVVLTIENEDGVLPVSFSEVAISRRAYRDGDGEYAINGVPCRLRDVVELFRDTGIGKEGYSLIGQGRIDEILSAKSEDRRQIFEEAAGIVKYKARKTEAEKRIENTRLNLSRVEDILHELEARVEPLRAQSETAREYLALTEELKGLELNLFLVRTERYRARLAELSESQASLRQAIAEAEAREAALTQSRAERQTALTELEAETAAAREAVQRLIGEVEAGEGTIAVLAERIASAQRDAKRVELDLSTARQGDGGVAAQIEALRAQIAAFAQNRDALQAACLRDETLCHDREARLAEREAALESAKARVIEAMNRLSDVRSEQSRLHALKETLVARIAALQTENSADQGETGELALQAARFRALYDAELAEKARLDALSAEAAERVRALGKASAELAEREDALRAQKQEVSSRLRVLTEMQRDYEGYQYAVKNVLLQAERMPGSGVHGVVATLIRVPQRIERAIDMALGAALQNIVVSREEDAKRMIDYLRKNRMGRATFLPLSAVRPRTLDANERRLLGMDGCLGVASELVEADPAYRGVLDNLLGRTLVVEHLDAAIAIGRAGRQALRIVTLDGDVMNPGGSMTGGSVHASVTSLLSREREVNEHRALLQQVEQALDEAAANRKAQEDNRGALKKERAELFDRLHQQEIACAREEAHLAAADAELHGQKERAQRATDAKAQLEAQLASVDEALSRSEAQKGDEGEAQDQHQAEIARVQAEVLALRAQTDALRAAVADQRVALAACERDLKAAVADRDRLVRQKDDIASLLRESEAQQCEIAAQLARDTAQRALGEASLAERKQALETTRDDFRRIDKNRVDAQTALREINEGLDRIHGETADFADRAHRGEVQLTRVQAEFEQMTARIWEDYELSYEGASAFRAEAFKLAEADKRVADIRRRVRDMGSVNVAAVDEYRETVERFESLGAQRDDLLKAELDLAAIIDELTRKMALQFKREFARLNENFKDTFVTLFGGGQAELRLADPGDALACGIDIVAQPPGKKLQMLSLLSGGERALTAIAILFAMLKLKPTPFCFLDEIEAALDDANIDNFAAYLRDYARKTQFVVVTHRKGTMTCCDALYGVAMEEKGVSKLVSVKLD